jgi:hypothetical protein
MRNIKLQSNFKVRNRIVPNNLDFFHRNFGIVCHLDFKICNL